MICVGEHRFFSGPWARIAQYPAFLNKIKVYGGTLFWRRPSLIWAAPNFCHSFQIIYFAMSGNTFGAKENHGGTERAGKRHVHRWRDRGNDVETIQASLARSRKCPDKRLSARISTSKSFAKRIAWKRLLRSSGFSERVHGTCGTTHKKIHRNADDFSA
jgi:hypothetical protein